MDVKEAFKAAHKRRRGPTPHPSSAPITFEVDSTEKEVFSSLCIESGSASGTDHGEEKRKQIEKWLFVKLLSHFQSKSLTQLLLSMIAPSRCHLSTSFFKSTATSLKSRTLSVPSTVRLLAIFVHTSTGCWGTTATFISGGFTRVHNTSWYHCSLTTVRFGGRMSCLHGDRAMFYTHKALQTCGHSRCGNSRARRHTIASDTSITSWGSLRLARVFIIRFVLSHFLNLPPIFGTH